MSEYHDLSSGSTPARKGKWVSGFMARMADRLDEDTQGKVMSACSCPYRKDAIDEYRQVYTQGASLDDLLAVMRAKARAMIVRRLDDELNELAQQHPFYHSPVRNGNIVSFYAFPYHVAEYLREPDPFKRRRHACHCGWISQSKENYPLTYCACGTGFYQQLWQGILGQAVEIRPVQSVMHGDERCQFDVYLPEGL
jgi:hypothetical protein